MNKEKFSRYHVLDGGQILDTVANVNVKIFKSNDYLQCRMVDDDGIAHILGIHQVVAMFHCPDYFDGCVVHHKDGDKKNNCVYNLACMARSKHSSEHADRNRLKNYIKVHGPANKGKKMNDEFKKKCSEAAKLRGFNGNKYMDKYGNQR